MSKHFKVCLHALTGRIVHIDNEVEVPEGFTEGRCPDCGEQLVASNRKRESRKVATYFRHKSQANCDGESLVHLWAKQIILDKRILLGAPIKALGTYTIKGRYFEEKLFKQAESLYVNNAKDEVTLTVGNQKIIPDIFAPKSAKNGLSIEVFFSNKVSDEKAQLYKNNEIDCLEIDLSGIPLDVMAVESNFERYVTHDAPREWIYSTSQAELQVLSLIHI